MSIRRFLDLLGSPGGAGVALLATAVSMMALFIGVFYALLNNPVEGVPFGLVMLAVFAIFGAGTLFVWYNLGRRFLKEFSVGQRLTAIAIGMLPVFVGTLYQYWRLMELGVEECGGGTIVGMVVGTAATIGGVGTLGWASRPVRSSV